VIAILDLVQSTLTSRILAALKKIPKGKVATYGQIAALAGHPHAARQVARLLHTLSERERLPWHRVINRNGRISLPMDGPGGIQRRLLRKERVEVKPDGSLDLDRFGWNPRAGK